MRHQVPVSLSRQCRGFQGRATLGLESVAADAGRHRGDRRGLSLVGARVAVQALDLELRRVDRVAEIDARYRRGYADFDGLGPEFEGWETMGVWPEE